MLRGVQIQRPTEAISELCRGVVRVVAIVLVVAVVPDNGTTASWSLNPATLWRKTPYPTTPGGMAAET